MGKGSHYIVPNPEGGWVVKKSGSKRSSGHFDNKKDAIDSRKGIKMRLVVLLGLSAVAIGLAIGIDCSASTPTDLEGTWVSEYY